MLKRTFAVSVVAVVMVASISKANDTIVTSITPSGTIHHRGGSVAYDGKWYLWSGYSFPEGNHKTEKLEIYDPQSDSWSFGADCPVERNGLTAFELNGKLYSIGGEGHYAGSFSNGVHRYNPTSDSWEAMTNFPVNCWDRYGVVVDDTAYVFGGRSRYGATQSSMWKYDETTDSWSSCASMLESTMCGVTAVVDGKIYAIGGNHRDSESNSRPSSAIQVYDPQLNQWEIIGNCPIDFNNGAGIVYNDTIYLAEDSGNTAFSFDTVTQTWSNYDFDWPEGCAGYNTPVMIDGSVYLAADDRIHTSAYCVSSVPEPSTVILLGMSFVGFLATRFRKRR